MAALAAGLVAGVPASAAADVTPVAQVVVNEAYGGGGNSGATLRSDFVELYNKGTTPVDVSGWSVQYKSATGSTWSGVTPLTGTIPPGSHYLVKQADGAAGTTDLPAPDATGTISMSGTGGTVALVTDVTRLTCVQVACATAGSATDLVGYGSANTFAGGGPTAAPSNTTSVSRTGQVNTADNAADFSVGAPSPMSSGSEPEEPPPAPVEATIEQVQGTGPASPLAGQIVTTRGVVTAAYPTGGFRGFTIQTPGTGGSTVPASASPAVFVFSGEVAVSPGQHVEVTGEVSEFFGLTEITAAPADVRVLADAAAVAPTTTAWPASDADREKLESVLLAPTGQYTVTNTFATNQFGEVGLAFGDRPLVQPTDVARPGTAEYVAVVADNAARAVTLDDGATTNFLATANRSLTPPYISLTDPVRAGASATFNQPVVVDYRNGTWKLNPTTAISDTTPAGQRTTFENDRQAAPDAARIGSAATTVASFNVLNYFTTLGADTAGCQSFDDRTGDPVTVRGGCDLRGAFDPEDLARQQAKIVAAINALDAGVVGLMEIENSAALGETADEATATLVVALNEGARKPKWAYVPSSTDLPPAKEQDVITNALIYQPREVTPIGESRALGDQSADGQAFGNAREPIGQAFDPKGKGKPFFVAVNHFKSKGSGSGPGNVDSGDGQGASNADRVRQAQALRDWVPTALASYKKRVEDVFLVGDFNSYTREDPLQALYDAGYSNVNGYSGDPEPSYQFAGLHGSLDHVIVNASARKRVTGADVWRINAPESLALEYSRHNYHGTLFYAPDAFRSSDHDPVVVGVDAVRAPR